MDPKQLQAFMGSGGSAASNTALNPTSAKQSKRLFVYNLPSHASTNADAVTEFFNLQLNGSNVVSGDDPCISSNLSPNRDFALLEFKTPEDATAALGLNGVPMTADDDAVMNGSGGHAGTKLQIKRPKDYILPANDDSTEAEPGALSGVVKDSPDKLCVSNLPLFLDEEQLLDLLNTVGEIKSLVLAKDVETGQSKGFAFCEYAEPEMTNAAIRNLNGIGIDENNISLARASIGLKQASALGGAMSVNAMSMLAGTSSSEEIEQGRVIQLLNMVTPDELMDKQEYEGKGYQSALPRSPRC